MAAVHRGRPGRAGVVGVIEEYLRELRAGLRTRRNETERILAEAEDHLAQSVAAGRAAGLSEIEAREAAISAFGSVADVVRAHLTSRVRLRVLAAELGMAVWKLGWLWLVGFGAVRLLVMLAMLRIGTATLHIAGAPPGYVLKPAPVPPAFQAGWVLVLGLVLAAGYRLVRRRRPDPLAGFFPLVAAVFFVAATPVSLATVPVNGVIGTQGGAVFIAMVGLAVVYSARMAGTLIWQRTIIWQRRAS
jgi:hypothetical protein